MYRLVTLVLLFTLSISSIQSQNQLSVIEKNGKHQIVLKNSGKELLRSPSSGLWRISHSWNNNWPDEWIDIQADSVEVFNDYQILHGSVDIDGGVLKLRDAYREKNGLIQCTRRWEWLGQDTLKELTLTIQYNSQGTNNRVLIPGVLYYGNPAGERSKKTPVIRGIPGEISLFEEHRLPMPFVSREWGGKNNSKSAIIHSIPSPIPFANLRDQWWSMGVLSSEGQTTLCMMSGPAAFNGTKSVIKAFQGTDMMEEYNNAWLDLPPNTVIEKSFYLEGEVDIEQGSGFQKAVESSLSIFQPFDMSAFPDYDEILNAKINFSKSRYYENKEVAGFKKYPDRNFMVLGWCGQSMAPGYAYQILGDKYQIQDHLDRAQKSLDFLSTSSFYESGFYTWYNTDQSEWFMNNSPEWLSQGQAMLNMANAIRASQKSGLNSAKWVEFLKKASDFHADRILGKNWKPESTNEGFFIAPLVLASRIFNNEKHLEAADKAASYYADLYLNMKEVYWGGTLDASCEDKEGAFAALQGFIELYDHTLDEKYLKWAKHAGDVCLTYTVVWDIPLPPGRLSDHSFKSRGWTAVSVQNMHIDVYGVLIAPYIYRLGQALNKEAYTKTAELMFRSCGQLLDPYGSQGEQPYQTNYIQNSWKNKPLYERRGNYHETWTVFWITAHFLNAGAMLMELGAL